VVLWMVGDGELVTDFGPLVVVSRYAVRVLVSEHEKCALRSDACYRVPLVGVASLAFERLSLGI